MVLDGVVFLAGHTARASAYAQALDRVGLVPEATLLYGEPRSNRPGQGGGRVDGSSTAEGVFVPDVSVEVGIVVKTFEWNTVRVPQKSVNDPSVVTCLRRLRPAVVIFCGYGGEIVRESVLDCAPCLHVHSGWLPDYRGSTTGYYSWIEEGRLGASAILLDSQIDTGVILGRKRYALPPDGIDMDYRWDPAIRADLLVDILKGLANSGSLPGGMAQSQDEGRTFYVIHPLLKHLALLSQTLGRDTA